MIERSIKQLHGTAFEIQHEEYGLTHDGQRMFGIMGLVDGTTNGDYETLWGYRNSHDWGFAAAAGMGTRVWLCDNLAMATDRQLSRKHTLNIWRDLPLMIDEEVKLIAKQGHVIHQRYEMLKEWTCDSAESDHLIMESVRQGAACKKDITVIDNEYRNSRYPEFRDNTLWTLFNAFTQINQDKKLSFEYQVPRTVALHKVFDQYTNFIPADPSAYQPNLRGSQVA